MGLKRGTVKLEKHNNNWKDDFNIEKDNLEKLFGDVALKIEHIGSTSLNEIMAKPIIDIAVGVRSLDDFKKVENNFKNYPYSIKEDSVTDEILVRKEQNECIMYLIHVMEIESKRYIDTIVFRCLCCPIRQPFPAVPPWRPLLQRLRSSRCCLHR